MNIAVPRPVPNASAAGDFDPLGIDPPSDSSRKQSCLIEARRMTMSEGSSASSAAVAVGYGSLSPFTREYGRMFGLPPAEDTATAKR